MGWGQSSRHADAARCQSDRGEMGEGNALPGPASGYGCAVCHSAEWACFDLENPGAGTRPNLPSIMGWRAPPVPL